MEGDFRLLGPIDLLQLLAQGGKTGAFRVEGGEVYLERGRPVHAAYGGVEGAEALLAVLALKEGRFRFFPGEAAPRRTLEGPLEAYLLEAVRRLGEGVEVGPFDLVRPTAAGLEAQATLEPEAFALLQAASGGKSPLDLAAATGLPLGRVLQGLGQLARLRLVEVSPRVPRTARLRVARWTPSSLKPGGSTSAGSSGSASGPGSGRSSCPWRAPRASGWCSASPRSSSSSTA